MCMYTVPEEQFWSNRVAEAILAAVDDKEGGPHVRQLVDVLVQAVGEGQQQAHLATWHF